MIDLNELRRLAQAATPGPWIVNASAISELLDRLEAAEKERDTLRAKVESMERQVPIAYMPLVTVAQLESGGSGVVWCPHDRSVSDVPVYALPGAKGEEK